MDIKGKIIEQWIYIKGLLGSINIECSDGGEKIQASLYSKWHFEEKLFNAISDLNDFFIEAGILLDLYEKKKLYQALMDDLRQLINEYKPITIKGKTSINIQYSENSFFTLMLTPKQAKDHSLIQVKYQKILSSEIRALLDSLSPLIKEMRGTNPPVGMDTETRHHWLFGELMKAENPALMLKELSEGGLTYISEKMAAIARQFKGERFRELNNLKLANPDLKGEDFGIKAEIAKADWIIKLLAERIEGTPPQPTPPAEPIQEPGEQGESKHKTKPKYTLKQIALMHIYLGKKITRENAGIIAKQYGHTSGEALFHQFTRYSSTQNRKGNQDTEKKLRNQIKRIESITEHLTEKARQWANDEIKTLNTLLENKD